MTKVLDITMDVSENEVNLKNDWTPQEILERGLELLLFYGGKMDVQLGDEAFKRKLLHLDSIQIFVPQDQKR
jgi:hypothetical protein